MADMRDKASAMVTPGGSLLSAVSAADLAKSMPMTDSKNLIPAFAQVLETSLRGTRGPTTHSSRPFSTSDEHSSGNVVNILATSIAPAFAGPDQPLDSPHPIVVVSPLTGAETEAQPIASPTHLPTSTESARARRFMDATIEPAAIVGRTEGSMQAAAMMSQTSLSPTSLTASAPGPSNCSNKLSNEGSAAVAAIQDAGSAVTIPNPSLPASAGLARTAPKPPDFVLAAPRVDDRFVVPAQSTAPESQISNEQLPTPRVFVPAAPPRSNSSSQFPAVDLAFVEPPRSATPVAPAVNQKSPELSVVQRDPAPPTSLRQTSSIDIALTAFSQSATPSPQIADQPSAATTELRPAAPTLPIAMTQLSGVGVASVASTLSAAPGPQIVKQALPTSADLAPAVPGPSSSVNPSLSADVISSAPDVSAVPAAKNSDQVPPATVDLTLAAAALPTYDDPLQAGSVREAWSAEKVLASLPGVSTFLPGVLSDSHSHAVTPGSTPTTPASEAIQNSLGAHASNPNTPPTNSSEPNSVGNATNATFVPARPAHFDEPSALRESIAGASTMPGAAVQTSVFSSAPLHISGSAQMSDERVATPVVDAALASFSSLNFIPAVVNTLASPSSALSADQAADADPHSFNLGKLRTVSDSPASVAVPASEDTPVLAQAASVATITSKTDPVSLAANASSSSHIATGDAPVPNSTLMQRATGGSELSVGLQAWNGGDNAHTRLVQAAHLSGRLGESEMSIALKAEALGAVELRARVTGDQVGAAITVERHDAHAMLANDLPSLHQALSDRQLRVENVTVFQGSLHSGTAAGDSGGPGQQRDMTPQRLSHTNWTSAGSSTPTETVPSIEAPEAYTIFDSNGRLSVRA